MTIFRSEDRQIALVITVVFSMAVGFCGFIYGAKETDASDRRLLAKSEFVIQSPNRPVSIDVKGRTIFVSVIEARRIRFLDRLTLISFAIFFLGILVTSYFYKKANEPGDSL